MQKIIYPVGYTTGVFDLFHIGHLNILKRAKQHCEYLIVGVSTDDLVIEYKKKKPIIPFKERFEIVKSIKYVDKVVPQISRDKMWAYRKYKFNVMFVGDDWKGNDLFRKIEKQLLLKGTKVIYFPYTKNTSSTILRNVIVKLVTD